MSSDPSEPTVERPYRSEKFVRVSTDPEVQAKADLLHEKIQAATARFEQEPLQASTMDIRLHKRNEQFDDICASAKELFERKNAVYSDAIAETGVLGAVVAIVGINARLKAIVLRSPDAGESQADKLKDLIKDLHNYATIAGMMMMDNNWRGE